MNKLKQFWFWLFWKEIPPQPHLISDGVATVYNVHGKIESVAISKPLYEAIMGKSKSYKHRFLNRYLHVQKFSYEKDLPS